LSFEIMYRIPTSDVCEGALLEAQRLIVLILSLNAGPSMVWV
jgi:hypothetical protein